MENEILSIETAKRIATLEKENKELNDEIIKLRDMLYKLKKEIINDTR